MSIRVFELAAELGMASKELIGRAKALGLPVHHHSNSLDAEQEAQLRSGGGTDQGKIVRFDGQTGKGEVEVSSRGMTIPFDLKSTELANQKYVPIRPGRSVSLELDGKRVKTLTVE